MPEPTPAPPPTATIGPLPAATSDATITAVATGACSRAHTAAPGESGDLNSAGSALAPPLESFNQYQLDLVLDRPRATITGTETLQFTNRTGAALADLVFHLYPNLPEFGGKLDVTCAAVDDTPVDPVLEDGWLLRLPLPAPVAPEGTVEVTLHFETTHQQSESLAYGAFNAGKDLWTMASFYPQLALRVDDGWDTLKPNGWSDFVNSDMALYHARIRTPAGRLLTSGTVQGACTAEPCTVTVTAGPQRDFTLALASGWEEVRRTVGETTVVSSFPPAWRASGEAALDLAVDAVGQFNTAFGPYPYTELDILPVPAAGFAGVEYPGLMMISESIYAGAANPRQDLQDVVVHEVAHMWWYNVVGNDVLREPWLDEGLTSYSGEYLYPEWAGQVRQGTAARRQEQLARLGLDQVPIDQEVQAYTSAQAYVAVVYGRAPLFFDALRRELGDDAFFKLLREHYRRNAFSLATTLEFEALAEEIAGRDLDTFFQPWLSRIPN